MKQPSRLGLVAAVIVSTASALFVLYPSWLDLHHAVVGDWRHPDMISNHWLYRWVAERVRASGLPLAGGPNAFPKLLIHNDRYYWPVGDAPWLAGNGSDAVPATLLSLWFDWPGSVTLWAVLTVTLNGLGGWALARATGAGWAGSLVAAGALALFPYVAHEMMGARFSQAPLYWFAGFLAVWIRLLERPRLQTALMAGVLYGATAFTYWYYGLWAAMLGATLFAFKPNARALAAFLPVALATTVPLLAVFLTRWDRIPGTASNVFPNPLAIEASLPFTFPLWGGSVDRAEVAIPLAVTVGAVAAAVRWRELPWWGRGGLVAGTLFYLLALGPDLLLPNGTDTGIPGLYRLVYAGAAPLRRFWWPYRHVVPMTLALLPLAARGVDGLLSPPPRGRVKIPLTWLAPLIVLLTPPELAARGGRISVPTSWWESPPVYQKLATLPGQAIIELPLSAAIATQQQSLSYQWVHHKKLVNGHAMWVDRVRPRAWDEWVKGNSFLSMLQRFEEGKLFGPFAFKPEDVDALRHDLGIRLIVVNAEYFPRALYGLVPGYKRIFNQLFGPPVLSFRDQLFAWDLERYRYAGAVDAPEFRLPTDYLLHDGSRMLDAGYNRSLGWRTVARLFPPVIPPAAEAPSP